MLPEAWRLCQAAVFSASPYISAAKDLKWGQSDNFCHCACIFAFVSLKKASFNHEG
jgi:hypothetical protein